MPSIVVRGLDDHVKAQIAAQAKANGQSMDARYPNAGGPTAAHRRGSSECGAGSRWGQGAADSDARRCSTGGELRMIVLDTSGKLVDLWKVEV